MNKSALKRYEIEDDIIVVYAGDTSNETLVDWYDSSIIEMDAYTEPVKRLYDMRDLPTLTIQTVRMAIKVRRHPKADFAYTAVLTSNTSVAALVKAALSIQAGGKIQLFTDYNTAVAWLNEKHPT